MLMQKKKKKKKNLCDENILKLWVPISLINKLQRLDFFVAVLWLYNVL